MSIIAFALFASAAAAEPAVTSATGDWTNIPAVEKRGNMDGSPFVLDALERIADSGECRIAGLSKKRIRLNIPFLIRFAENGAVSQIVVRKLDCPAAETALGSAVKELAERGEYRPTGINVAGWYRGTFNVESTIY